MAHALLTPALHHLLLVHAQGLCVGDSCSCASSKYKCRCALLAVSKVRKVFHRVYSQTFCMKPVATVLTQKQFSAVMTYLTLPEQSEIALLDLIFSIIIIVDNTKASNSLGCFHCSLVPFSASLKCPPFRLNPGSDDENERAPARSSSASSCASISCPARRKVLKPRMRRWLPARSWDTRSMTL